MSLKLADTIGAQGREARVTAGSQAWLFPKTPKRRCNVWKWLVADVRKRNGVRSDVELCGKLVAK